MAQTLQGTIVSNSMKKTVVVEVSRLIKHPRYGKYIRISKRYQAHTEETTIPIGSIAVIESTSPLSRHKQWRVISFQRPTSEVTISTISLHQNIVEPREQLEDDALKI